MNKVPSIIIIGNSCNDDSQLCHNVYANDVRCVFEDDIDGAQLVGAGTNPRQTSRRIIRHKSSPSSISTLIAYLTEGFEEHKFKLSTITDSKRHNDKRIRVPNGMTSTDKDLFRTKAVRKISLLEKNASFGSDCNCHKDITTNSAMLSSSSSLSSCSLSSLSSLSDSSSTTVSIPKSSFKLTKTKSTTLNDISMTVNSISSYGSFVHQQEKYYNTNSNCNNNISIPRSGQENVDFVKPKLVRRHGAFFNFQYKNRHPCNVSVRKNYDDNNNNNMKNTFMWNENTTST